LGSIEVILLDTHAWVWWLAEPERLTKPAHQAIQRNLASGSVGISTFSTWELALLVQRKRLQLSIDLVEWIAETERIKNVTFYPVNNHIALQSVNLPGSFHPDPADRILVATARHLGATMITGDAKILDYPHVKSLW
jgi:PIN domain nuclease of toxin-antitoxin system